MRSKVVTSSSGILAAFALLVACDRPGPDIMADFETLPSASVPGVIAPAHPRPSAAASASGSAPPSASGSASAAPATSASGDKPPARVWECGDKGKPDCPMQRWMKSVAGGAVASGDNERLARAFQSMSRPPPGMGAWASICATGAAKAQAGDFDGAKAQCKVCHGKYQSSYHASMRDNKW